MLEARILDLTILMLYAVGATVNGIASIYLLLRRGNAFDAEITTPVRLRRWTSAFFASMALSHIWYMPSVLSPSSEAVDQNLRTGGMLDCMTVIPLAIIVLICMLQDHRRPLWPAWAVAMPLTAGMGLSVATHDDSYRPAVYVYFMLLMVGLVLFMAYSLKKYGRWLRDNYADLEHKEVWQIALTMTAILLLLSFYVGGIDLPFYELILQICCIALTCALVWRVETLSDLTLLQAADTDPEEEEAADGQMEAAKVSPTALDYTGTLLQQHCEETGLYLQHDLTVQQLALAIGINRTYLSRYFASRDTTYNAYISDLRIGHFVRLYQEAIAARRPVSAQQLASESGFRSYSTFSVAFKQRMQQNVSSWVRTNSME